MNSGTWAYHVSGWSNLGAHQRHRRHDQYRRYHELRRTFYTGGGETTDRVVNLNGTTGGITLRPVGQRPAGTHQQSDEWFCGPKTLTLQGSTAGTGELDGAIVDSSNGATSVSKQGTGQWTLAGSNTYTGGTTVSGGTLQLGNNGALGATSGSLAIYEHTVDLNGNSPTIHTDRQFRRGDHQQQHGCEPDREPVNADHLWRHAPGRRRWATFALDERYRQVDPQRHEYLQRRNHGQRRHVGHWSNRLPGQSHDQRRQPPRGFDRGVQRGHHRTQALAASGTVNFNNPTRTLSMLNGPATGVVNLNGTNLTVNSGGAFAGTLQNGAESGRLDRGGEHVDPWRLQHLQRPDRDHAGTLQIGNGGGNGSIAGTNGLVNNGTLAVSRSDNVSDTNLWGVNSISGSGGLVQLGPGALTLTLTNSYTGVTTINSGTLVTDTAGINGDDTTNGIAFGGGTLKANDSAGINTNKAITATSTILLDTTNGPITLGGDVASTTSGLTLTGANMLILSASNNYSGGTTVSGGTLQVKNPAALGTGGLTANAGVVDLNSNQISIPTLNGSAGRSPTTAGRAASLR